MDTPPTVIATSLPTPVGAAPPSLSGETLRQVLEAAGVDVVTTGVDSDAGMAYVMVAVGATEQRFETSATTSAQEASEDLTHQVDLAHENNALPVAPLTGHRQVTSPNG